MAFYKHRYMNQTVEHCLKHPRPDNVDVHYMDDDVVVYTVDLPASVWMAVTIPVRDMYDYTEHRFESASLRQEWIDNYTDSLRLASPSHAARPGR